MFISTYYVFINQTLALTLMIQDSVETKVFFFRRKIMKGIEKTICFDMSIVTSLSFFNGIPDQGVCYRNEEKREILRGE